MNILIHSFIRVCILGIFIGLNSIVNAQTPCVAPYNPTPASSWGMVQKFQTSTGIWNGGTPTAADLNGDGISEILVPASDNSGYFVYKGDGSNATTGKLDFQIAIQSAYSSQPAIADIVSTSAGPEVIAVNTSGYVYIFASTGGTETNYLYKSTTASQYTTTSTPYLVDIDGDGKAEIVLGSDVFGIVSGALVKIVAGPALGYVGQTAGSTGTPVDVIVADILSSNPGKEIIYGSRVYGVNLTTGVTTKLKDLSTIVGSSLIAANDNGPTAVGDMNGDGKLDIVYNGSSFVVMWDPNGTNAANTLLFRRIPPSFNYGTRGLPLIANVFNDITTGSKATDLPEAVIINSVSGSAGIVTAYNLNYNTTAGTATQHIWSIATNDMSGCTGITAFDFDGNGIREIVYRDQSTLRIINGNRTTPVNYATADVASSTWGEYPIVADLNNDGQAEIAVTGNNMLQVFGSNPTTFPWRAAPNYWNQRNYRIVNINSNLTIPTTEINAASLIAYNNNAAQFQFADAVENGVASGNTNSADAQITINTVTTNCPTITVAATISNTGSYLLPAGTFVAMYDANPTLGAANLIGTFQTTATIAAGGSINVTMTANLVALSSNVFAVVNDKGTTSRPFNLSSWTPNTGINECSYTNNISSKTFTCTDSDGDNVVDYIDIDDDNDGILDTIEQSGACATVTLTPFSATSSPVYGGSTAEKTIDGSGFTGTGLTALASAPAILDNAWLLKEPETSGFIEYLMPAGSNVGGVALWAPDAFNYGGGDGPPKDFTVEVTYEGGRKFTSQVFTTAQPNSSGALPGAQAFYFPKALFNVTKLRLNILSGWYDINNNSIGQISSEGITVNAAYNMFLGEFRAICGIADIDTDNDGIPNRLDLDSDGDGCTDAIEAGVSGTLNSGTVKNGVNGAITTTTTLSNAIAGSAGNYGANGLANSVETALDNGILNYTNTYVYAAMRGYASCADTDNDNINDVVDIDDDNDGVLDNTELSCTSPLNAMTPTTTGATNIFSDNNTGTFIKLGGATLSKVSTTLYETNMDVVQLSGTSSGAIVLNNTYQLLKIAVADVDQSESVNLKVYDVLGNLITLSSSNISQRGSYVNASYPTGSSIVVAAAGALTYDGSTNSISNILIEIPYTAKRIEIYKTAGSNNTWVGLLAGCNDGDTDNDGIPNRLDLDSDGDGCSDAIESGSSTTATSTTTYSAFSAGDDTNSNGLLNVYESATAGVVNYSSQYDPYALSKNLAACIDTDGDGIFDLFDIDDDNDGIIDAVESPDCFMKTEEWNTIDKTIQVKITSTLNTLSTNNKFSSLTDNDGAFAAVQFSTSTAQSQLNKEIFKVEFSSPTQLDALYIKKTTATEIFAATSSSLKLQGSNDNSSWTDLTAAITRQANATNITVNGAVSLTNSNKFTVTAGAGKYKYYRIYGVVEANILAGIASEFYFDVNNSTYYASYFPKVNCTNDNDADGIFNHQDLDSDADGCSDAVEAGTAPIGTITYGSRSFFNPTTTGANGFGTNGFLNTLETVAESNLYKGVYSYYYANNAQFNACTDTDGDGVPNLIDIDDDNDGILDAIESPTCFYTATELSLPIAISTELSPYSTNLIGFAIDGNATTLSAFDPSVNWVGKELFKLEALFPIPVASLDMDLATWALSSVAGNTFKLQGSNDNNVWTDLSTAQNSTGTTGTYSLQNTVAPTTKYKNFRVIGVAGVSNYGGVTEIRFNIVNSFVQSQYSKPTCLTGRNDGDLVPNHLDLDSDGDGCSDALEAGTISNTTANFKFTSTNNIADFGANGFYNNLEKTNSESNLYKGIYTYDYATDNIINACSDFDGDGAADLIDLDDDNDGVLDAIESPTCFYTLEELSNPTSVSSELTQHTASYVIGNSIDGVGTTASAFTTGQDWVGKEIFKFTAKNYIAISGMSFNLVSWPLSSASTSTFKLQGSGDNQNWTDLSTTTFSSNTTGAFTISNTLAATTKFKYFRLLGVAGTNGYGGVYEAKFTFSSLASPSANPKPTCTNDTDGDGKLNQNDLDSDGDGCPDAVEAGTAPIGTKAFGSVSFFNPATTGANGFTNSLETATESGIYSGTYKYIRASSSALSSCLDTDGDGISDIDDIDDDNDGITDLKELNCTFANSTDGTCTDALKTTSTYGIFTHCSGWNAFDFDPSPSVVVRADFDYMGVSGTDPYFDLQGSYTTPLTGKMVKSFATTTGLSYTFEVELISVFADDPTTGSKPYLRAIDATTGEILGTTYLNGSGIRTVSFMGISSSTLITLGYDIGIGNIGSRFWKGGKMTQNGEAYQICSFQDTDNDGVPNQLDLDSDGDGCPDAVEAGTTFISTSGVASSAKLTTSVIPAPYGANGFANGLETSTESGAYTGTYTYKNAIDATISGCKDSDGDGVPDVLDIDDDNDGILDSSEQINCVTSGIDLTSLTYNGSSISAKTASSFTTAGGDTWKSSYSNENLKLPISLKFKHNSTTGYEMFGLLPITNTQTPASWNDAGYKFYPQNSITYGYFTTTWDINAFPITASDVLSIDISASGYVTAAINGVTQKAFQGVVSDYKLDVSSYRASSLTDIILTDATRPVILTCTELDTDKDGIPNRLDLDSDGDGCPDAVEAGTTAISSSGVLTTAKYSTSVIPAPYGNNGFANGLETTSESGAYTGTYTYNFATNSSFNGCTDTDGDGVPDVLDLDDDNDGVLDTGEQEICRSSFNFATIGTTSQVINLGGGLTVTQVSSAATAAGSDNAGNLALTSGATATLTFSSPIVLKIIHANNATVVFDSGDRWNISSPGSTFTLTDPSMNLTLNSNGLGAINFTPKLVGINNDAEDWTIKTSRLSSITFKLELGNPFSDLRLEVDCGFDLDTDADGIPNRLDLDSDGDGCPDAKESGVNGTLSAGSVKNGTGGAVTSTTTVANAIAAGPYGNNGLANGVETSTESGVVTYTSTYANNALVIDLVAPTITTQPLNRSVFVGAPAVLTTTVGAPPANRTLTYQWYKAGVAITGATSATYTVTSAAISSTSADYYCLIGYVNSCLTTNTNTVNITVLTNPVGLTACQDGSAVLSVTKTGTNAVTYQWKKATTNLVNGANIAGATTTSLTLTNLALADAGAYTLVATDANGAVITSLAGTITITNNTKYTIPDYTTCVTASNYTLTAASVATTTGAITTTWERSTDGGNTWLAVTSASDGVTYTVTTTTSGGTSTSTLRLSSVIAGLNGYKYRIATTNATCTNYSNAGTLNVNAAPTITAQPSNSVLCNIYATNFTAAATGSNLTYKWQTRAPAGTWTTITSSNANTIDAGVVYSNYATASLNLSASPSTENNNEYQVVFTNSCGTVTSTTAILNPTVATPTITGGNISVCEGTAITLTTSSSTASATYQWYFAGTAIGGATGVTYNPTSSGNYSVIANATGYCSSGTASSTVTINPIPSVTIAQGAVLTLTSGGSIQLTATASPSGTYSYTWYNAGSSVSGPALTNIYTVGSVGTYTVKAANTITSCNATSASTIINVLPSPSVNGSTTICSGGSVGMSVAIADGQTIQWESTTDVGTYSYTAIVGATTTTYNATPTNLTSSPISINYRAVISTGTNTTTAATGTTIAIVVSVNPLPTATISNTASGTTLCAGTNAILTASSGAASATYQWYNNNSIISGATASTYSTTGSGIFSFKVTDGSTSCAANSISSTVTVVSPPAAPNLTATSKIICVNTTADLTVFQPLALAGISYEWHSASNTLSSTLVANAASVGTAGTYYLFAKNNSGGCYSTASVAFTLSIVTVGQATLTGASSPTYTIGDIPVALNASTSNPTYTLRWYTALTGGVALAAPVLPSTATAGVTNYYVEQYDASASFCTSSPRQLAAVTVKPLAPIVANITYCQNATAVALTATPAIGGTLNWYGTAATGGTLTATATIPATGTVTNTTYYVSQTVNGVEGARAALTVSINAAPSAPSIITGTFSVTSTNSYTYSVTSIASTTYQWTLPSFMSGTSSTNSISALVNAAGSGIISVIAVNANGCLSPARTTNISAVLYVAAVPVTTNASYTIGDPSNPANTASQITAATGATLNYYTSNAAGSTSTSEQSIPATAGVYTYYVSQTINGVESALVPYTVTIKPQKPIVADITYCQNDVPVALTATGTALQWYTVSTSGTATSTAPTPSTGTATSTTYYVTQTVNGVESDRIALVVTINPTPATPSAISGLTITSTANSETYSVTNDASATGYVWILPSGWTGTSSINSITAAVGLSGGQIKVKAINGSCASPFSTLTVDILNVTNPPVTSDVTFVTGSTPSNILSNTSALITGTASSTINYYTSNAAGAASSTSQTTPTEPGVYTYYVSQTSNLGVESILVPYTVTVKPVAPPINTNNGIVGNAITYCKGASAFALTATVSAGGTLKWYTVATGGASSNSAPTPSTSLVGTSNYYVSQVVNGVESDRVLIVVTVNDAPSAITATATQPTCTNSSGYIVITSPLGTGFTYSVDGSNYTNTTLFSALPAGIYYATAKNNFGCVSAPTPITINTAVAPPLSPLVTLTQPTCASATGSITILSTTLSTDNFSIDGGLNYQASKTFVNVTPGTYTVTTLNAGGCVSAGTAAIVNAALPVPTQPSISSSSASASICEGTTLTLTSSASTGNQWYKDGVLIAGAINQTYSPIASGNYTVIATNTSGCSSIPSAAELVTFNPLPTPIISNGATLAFNNCATTIITLTASNTNTSTGNTYQWYLNGNSINVAGTSSTYNANAAGEYSVVITNNGCSTTSAISKLIAAPSVNAANTAFCEGGSSLISGISSGFTSPTYQWKVSTNDGLSFSNAAGTGTNLTYTATTAGKYQLQVTDGGIVSTSCPINVTVFTNPTANITASPSASVCVGTSISLSSNASSGTASYTYQWLLAGGNDIAGAILSTYTTGITGSYAVKVTDANGCIANAAPSSIIFNAVPTAPVLTITNPTCAVNTGTISVTSPLGVGYTYSIDGINYTNTTGLFTGLTASSTYTVTVKSSTGCTSNATMATIAAALVVPAQPVITGPDNINPFSLNTYSVAAVTGATSYSWNIPGYWSGVSTTNTITIKVDASAGSFSVTANSASCVSIAATKNITATILNPDVNVTDINLAVSGKLSTNDVVPAGTTYGQPGSNAANPTGASITVNADGSYTFTATTPGKYIYYVPVCAAGQTTGCPVSPLEITVLDPLAVTDKPVANNDMATAKPGVPTTVNILANDAAGNSGGTLNNSSVSIAAAPKHGVVVVNSDGTITYTAAAGFVGTDSVIYNVCDNSSPTPLCQTAVVYFTVVPTSAPSTTIAVDDYATVLASTGGTNAVSGNVLTNDKNTGGASLTATVVAGPSAAQGTFTMNADGSYTFTPTAGFSGPVDITYTVCTGATPASCATATIHILVEPAQVLNPDAATAYINIPKTGNISTNDVIQPGSTYAQPAQQSGATITVNTDGTYSFTATDPGTYTYVITVCAIGQTTNCPTETLVITVPVNTLVDNTATAYINVPSSGNISSNDVVPAGTSYGQPAQQSGATITVNPDGTYSFTATTPGTYTYTVPVCAPGQTTGCPTETLVITVPVSTIVDDAANALINIPSSGSIATNDVIPPGTSYGQPAQQSGATITVNTDGTYSFTATTPGTYTYTVPVCAPGQTTNCPTETLVITVPVNTIVNDAATAYINIPISGNISTNDVIPAGSSYGQPAQQSGATITVNPDGTYSFTATTPGTYTYTVPVCAPGQTTNCPTETLVITVPVNKLVNDAAIANINIPTSGNVSTNDAVPAGTSYGQPAQQSGATITVNPDGTYNFTATASGTYTYTIPVCAPGQTTNCPTETLVITVSVKTIVDDTATAYVNIAKSGNISTNDAVPAGSSYGQPSQISGATITVNPDGTYSFTATTAGTYTYTVPVCAPGQTTNCPTETLVITVPVNTIVNDAATTNINTPISGNISTNDIVPAGTTYGQPAQQSGATITINANGTYSFTATAAGTYTYTVPVCAPGQTSNCPTEILVITVLNPVINIIVPDFNVTNTNVPVNGNLSTNDQVPAGTSYGQPAPNSNNPIGSTITINSNGTYTFKATNAGTYTYYVPTCAPGQTSGCPLTPLVITVVDPLINTNPPIANTDIATTTANTPVTTNVLANDKAANVGGSLNPASLSIATQPKHGAVVVNKDGTITYTPAAGFVGTDSLTYSICDNSTPLPLCKTAVVYYTVNAASSNNVTTAADDFANTKELSSVSGNVLSNDKNTAGAALKVTSIPTVPASKGQLQMNADGSYVFTPAAGFTGTLDLIYTVCGGTPEICVNATLHILVEPILRKKVLDITKVANSAKMNLDGSFNVDFIIKTKNLTSDYIDSILVKDDLTKVFTNIRGVSIVSVIVSGKLVRNKNYDGILNTDLLSIESALDPNKEDSIILTINVSNNLSGIFANTAVVSAPTNFGLINLISTDPTVIASPTDSSRKSTLFKIPLVEVIIPGGFSPNNDGIDDTWKIQRPFGTKISVQVFNRWGNEVYANDNYVNDWRGKGVSNFMGEEVVEGTYFYIVLATDIDGAIRKFAGSLTIVR